MMLQPNIQQVYVPPLIGAVGNTPLVDISVLLGKSGVRLLAKLEGSNPGGSVKDRPALYMIEKAEQSGELTRAKIILEPTSGNTGIAIAMIGAAKGYRVKLVMPACVSTERRGILEAYGAETVLSPGCEMTDGAINLAHKILAEDPDRYYMPNQYSNPNNPLAHYETTGPEIFSQTAGDIDYLVAGMGTSGTLMGLSRYFSEVAPAVKVIGVEPGLGHKIQGLKNMCEAIVPAIYDESKLAEKLLVGDEEAYETTRQLALKMGLFAGMSSGAAVAGALRIAQRIEHGTIVALLPDRGDRYLSTNLFRSQCAECPP
ncbi:PLP-dependent cysteine synthase family protein [Pelobacter seleniigenes]|uniref:PLP-dependent cysteine synthase family protein n=1 Tax=Pelobacter seleniigenes TaxID=407188 RepID=UPI001FE00D15|nr:cysteine synthase family protein [Pelobacter seleniigenes]